MNTLKKINSETSLNEITAILEEDGAVVITGLLSEKEFNSLQEELTPELNATPNCNGDFYGYSTKRISSLIAKSPTTRELATNETILRVLDHFLLENCSHYQLNLTQGIQIGPGEPAQIIHRDDLMFPYPHTGSEWMINCMWAIDDFTLENGATNLVLGSHKWDPERQPNPDEIIQADMEAGSVLIYMASLLHGGGENISKKLRTGLVLSYNLGWLKQAENQFLAIPLEVAKEFSEDLQRLIGYFVHEPNLGSVDGQDPILKLRGENTNHAEFKEFISDEAKELLREYRDGKRSAA